MKYKKLHFLANYVDHSYLDAMFVNIIDKPVYCRYALLLLAQGVFGGYFPYGGVRRMSGVMGSRWDTFVLGL